MSIEPVTELPSRPSPGAAGAQLGELYAHHSRLVYGICRMLLRDPDEAEDATQQVFLSAYRNLLTGTQVRDPAAWLGTIARNACRRRATERMHEPLAVNQQPTLVSPAADVQASGREEAAALYAELAALPAKQREAVVLRDLYGLRYDEVAAALGTSRPAVEALLFRGRRRLKVRLRPGVAAGVLVVPLAVHESIAYAVPGFASTAAPAGAVAAAAGVPLLAKLAAAGAAVGLAGSAGYATERSLHDPPARPAAATRVEAAKPQPLVGVEPIMAAALPPAPPAGSPIAEARKDDREDSEHPGGGDPGEQEPEQAGERKDEPDVEHADADEPEVEEADVDGRAEDDRNVGESGESDGGEAGGEDVEREG